MSLSSEHPRATAAGTGAVALSGQALAQMVERLRSTIPGLQAVYLFGSAAHGQMRETSDVDVAVLAGQGLPTAARWDVQEQLADELHRDVHLLDLRGASTVMRMQVVASGRLLYEADASARHRFEMYVSAAYADLNEERSAILEDVHRRGSVYGG